MPTIEQVREALKVVTDPEIGIDVVNLGLVYGVDITDPLLYDAVLNTSRLGVEGAAEAGVTVARLRLRESGA